MIEELEAEAVAQLVAGECGGVRAKAKLSHQGTVVEVRARRRNDGGVVLGYSYGGVRLERAILLLLMCPQVACERSRSAKTRWEARNPPLPALQRRPRNGMKTVGDVAKAQLFDEVPVGGARSPCVARPASFAVLTSCPVNAHEPAVVRMHGWDLFRRGKYVAGGLAPLGSAGTKAPRFPSIEAAIAWVAEPESSSRKPVDALEGQARG